MSEGISEPYPGDYYRELINKKYTTSGGFDIYKSKKKWVALVVCESNDRRTIRFYTQIWKEWKNEWKVDLARMNCEFWDWEAIFEYVRILKDRFGIKETNN